MVGEWQLAPPVSSLGSLDMAESPFLDALHDRSMMPGLAQAVSPENW